MKGPRVPKSNGPTVKILEPNFQIASSRGLVQSSELSLITIDILKTSQSKSRKNPIRQVHGAAQTEKMNKKDVVL